MRPNDAPGGLIPAHAGSTTRACCSADRPSAHPRSRGEHIHCLRSCTRAAGSSPLTRGARNLLIKKAGECGLIPAHAGSTAHHAQNAVSRWAHPRSRGEHEWVMVDGYVNLGSSPLTRGARCEDFPALPRLGLIPAHAGSTVAQAPSLRTAQAHPRSRGEHGTRWSAL